MKIELETPNPGTSLPRRAGAAAIVGLACYGLVTLGAVFPCLAGDCAARQPVGDDGPAFADARLQRLEEDLSLLRRDLAQVAVARAGSAPLQPAAPASAPDLSLREDVITLYAELAGLYREVQELRSVGAEPAAAAHAGAAAMPQAAAEDEARRSARHFAAIESRLAGQDVDPAWSMAAADTIERALADTGMADFSLAGVDCRSSLCRVDIGIPGDDDSRADELPVLLVPALGQTFNNFAMDADSGAGSRIVYLWNEDGETAF